MIIERNVPIQVELDKESVAANESYVLHELTKGNLVEPFWPQCHWIWKYMFAERIGIVLDAVPNFDLFVYTCQRSDGRRDRNGFPTKDISSW